MTIRPLPGACRPASGTCAGPALAALVAAAALTFANGAQAGEKKAPPAPHASAPRAGGAPGMGGGAHIPGSMAGGAHIPGSMGGGAHIPGSMAGGAHIPGNMAGGAHVPGAMSRPGEGARGTQAEGAMSARGESRAYGASHHTQSAAHHEGKAAPHDARGAPAREARAGERGTERAGEHAGDRTGGRAGEHGDPRIGGRAALHTRLAAGAAVGAGAALAAHHFGAEGFGREAGRDGSGRDFRARPTDRDIGRDRAFASAHAHDFHARFVRDFTPAEFGRWRAGLWSAGWHFGRFGWWWDVDGVWYPYAVPVFPFPLEVSAITVYGNEYIDAPALAAAPSIPPLPAAPAALYSCAAPSGYYPAVAACGQPWQMADVDPSTTMARN